MINKCIDLLRDLVAFDTTSRNSNLACIDYIQRYLDELGIASELFFNDDRSKANLFATIGEASIPGLVLSGHMDVVPVDGQDWSSDPFELIEKDNKLFARGTCDMKGFIAVCLAMAESFKNAKLPIPIHFAFSYDEEIGCIGVRSLISALAKRDVKPLACVVGEPSSMQIISAHKGMLHNSCSVRGCAGHSSLPDQAVNSIFTASQLIAKLQEIGENIKKNGPFDSRFSPPYSTVNVGVINAGTAINIIPEHCKFEYEVRNIPSQNPDEIVREIEGFARDEILPQMKTVSEQSDISWEVHAQFPGLDTPDETPINGWMQRVLETNLPLGGVSYGTEAGLFSDIGIDTIVCGPGSIEQAHRPNEFVEISQLQACLDFMRACITQLENGHWVNR